MLPYFVIIQLFGEGFAVINAICSRIQTIKRSTNRSDWREIYGFGCSASLLSRLFIANYNLQTFRPACWRHCNTLQ